MKTVKWGAAALAVIVITALTPFTSIAQGKYHYACATEYAYIYRGRSERTEKIAVVPEGGVCRVLADGDGFSYVFSGGFTGYIDSGVLDSSQETLEGITSQDGVAADTDVNIYAAADKESEVIAQRKEGATEYLSMEGSAVDGWIKIEVVIDANSIVREGWVLEEEVTPARVVSDAEPYILPEDEGFFISSSDSAFIEDARILRENAKRLAEAAKPKQNTGQKKGHNGSAKPGVLNPHVGTVIGPTGNKETYYNLEMKGVVAIMRSKGFSEEEYPYWVREDGAKMLGDYIMCAADLNLRPRGSLVESSLGTCIVADTGDFIYSNPTQIDIAVLW